MTLRVRDMPPGVTFKILRNGRRYTMVCKDPEHRYQHHVIAHNWTDKRGILYGEHPSIINGQSHVKPVIRILRQ